MSHESSLIATIVGGLALAFLFGTIAQRLRMSPLAGYLLAGIAVGPFTPGFTANGELAGELAEIGVILLMFGVGLHFSQKDLLSVRAVAIPGALAQIAASLVLGAGVGWLSGWPLAAGLVFGLALSVASTVVSLRGLQEQRATTTERGHIIIGWLIVQDIVMIFVLVLLPSLAPVLLGQVGGQSLGDIAVLLLITLGKVVGFVTVMLLAGPRVIPLILHYIAHTGSRELFRLGVLVIALGVAFGAAHMFGVSFALGAFFAGMVMSESELSHRATQETLPLRDAFAVLFFVSVGMLVDPAIVLAAPAALTATIAIVLVGKTLAGFFLVRLVGHDRQSALAISLSLAQVGEFSFILAGLAVSLGLLPDQGRSLILAAALFSIIVNPLLAPALRVWQRHRPAAGSEPPSPHPPPVDQPAPSSDPAAAPESASAAPSQPWPEMPPGHTVVVGYGRVGRVIGAALRERRIPYLVVEDSERVLARMADEKLPVLAMNAASPDLAHLAGLATAHCLFIAIPNAFEAGQLVEHAHRLNPDLMVVARAHSDDEADYLARLGATHVIMGEREIAMGMLGYVFDWQSP